jgi:hypothetical protein
MTPLRILALALASGFLLNASCSSSDDNSSNGNTDAGPPGGPVVGVADSHCEGQPLGVADPTKCGASGDTAAGGAADDGDTGSTAGAADCTLTHDAAYGATLFNTEGDDDDCKYHASFTVTPVRLNEDVTFTVSAIDKTSMQPLAPLADGDLPLARVEVYQPCDLAHRPPLEDFSAKLAATSMPGTFTAGPFKFDEPGRWVVRFHFYEECFDQDNSPHGHIAFFIDVP